MTISLRLALLCAVSVSAFAAVDGVVMNKTSGAPAAGVSVTLNKLSQAGPEPLGTAKTGADGKFSFSQTLPPGPALLQAEFEGVQYNAMITPGAPTTGVEIPVWAASAKAGSAQVSDHLFVLEPNGQQANITETVLFKNGGNVTFSSPRTGTLRFFLPAAANGQVRVNATEPGGLPLEQGTAKTKEPNVLSVDFPIKPGETRFDISYTVPLADGGAFAGRSLYPAVPLRIAVPSGVTLEGKGVDSMGPVPNSQASLYSVKDAAFTVNVKGGGSMASAQSAEEDSGPQIQQILPRAYDNLPWILAPALLVLILGFALLYRRGSVN